MRELGAGPGFKVEIGLKPLILNSFAVETPLCSDRRTAPDPGWAPCPGRAANGVPESNRAGAIRGVATGALPRGGSGAARRCGCANWVLLVCEGIPSA